MTAIAHREAPVRTVVTRYALTAPLGVALTIAGELTGPLDVGNAVAVGQYGLAFLAAGALFVAVGLRWPASRRFLVPALATLTALTAVAYFLPLGWVLGCAGWSLRGAGGSAVTRVAGLVCAFVAGAWFVAYLSAVVIDLM